MPNDFGPLFSYPNRAGFKEPTTSKDAANEIEAKGRAAKLMARVEAWYGSGHTGTADECAAALHEEWWSIRPRVTQLYKLKRLERTGVKRPNASGNSAHVMRVRQTQTARAG